MDIQNPLFDCPKDALDGQHLIDCSSANRLGIHSEDDRCSFILRKYAATGSLYSLCPARPIVSHSGKDYARAHGATIVGSALESYIGAWTVSENARSIVQSYAAGRRDAHVV